MKTDIHTALATLLKLAREDNVGITVNITIKTNEKPAPRYEHECKLVISVLNEITGRDFKNTESNHAHIRARLSEGHSIADFTGVIKHMHKKWGSSDKFKQFLRPQTLFGTKFESYLQDAKKNSNSDWGQSRGW